MSTDYINIFKELDKKSKTADHLLKILDAELALPNIPMPTMGGEVFWNTLVEHNGWKLQQNMFTRHARILDSDNTRIAWGTINGMEKALDRMVEYLHKYENPNNSLDSMEKLKKLKELLDIGAITEDEFVEKKSKLLKNI